MHLVYHNYATLVMVIEHGNERLYKKNIHVGLHCEHGGRLHKKMWF